MRTQQERVGDSVVKKALSSVDHIFGSYRPRDFAVRLWDGTTWGPETGQPARFTLVLHHPDSLKKMFWPPGELTLAEAYIHDDFDIEGDIESVFPLGDYFEERSGNIRNIRLLADLFHLPAAPFLQANRAASFLKGTPHSKKRDWQAVTYHYNISNDFYRLWLDRQLVYSCAYFDRPDEALDAAQERKLDYICRKLRLKPGERLLDIGCGWGALIVHAASRYGARARGITLSEPQAQCANDRIRGAGLAGSCTAEVMDYRDIAEREGYDKLVSVGMFEHVGVAKLRDYFDVAWRLLKPGGFFLNHGIAYGPGVKDRNLSPFIHKYVFPDGELVPVTTTLNASEDAGFEIRDVESLREHYALTLRHWVRRLESNYEKALQAAGEAVYRVWRLYMSGAAHYFTTGRLNVYQALLVKPDRGVSGLPLTRSDLYC
ncbi:MAG TPA: cyclopropane-fatty-acyl-phospholipid synthase family protein [Syntrophales bacterium]|nr:cyclopropane-fatty-acyl-phospholipid synthase family protein [Syntrophales bacterium]